MEHDDLEMPWDDDFKAELEAIENEAFPDVNEDGKPLRKTSRKMSSSYKRNIRNMASHMSETDAAVGSVNSADLSDLDEGENPTLDM